GTGGGGGGSGGGGGGGVGEEHVRVGSGARGGATQATELADRGRGVTGVTRGTGGGEPRARRTGAHAEPVDPAGDAIEPGFVGARLGGGREAGRKHHDEAEAPARAHRSTHHGGARAAN